MKKLIVITGMAVLIYACSGGGEQPAADSNASNASDMFAKKAPDPAHEAKGIGKFTNVEVSPSLDVKMAEDGKGIYDLKCSACHKLTKERLVGPGWSEVTSRRKVEWIMNFTTNPDEMLDNDPTAQAMLEECLVRMPNQQISDEQARNVYEFMRQNDGIK